MYEITVGKKWSLFLEKVFWHMIKDLGVTGARFDVTDSTITIKINLKQYVGKVGFTLQRNV
jgi:hypothetical protein